MKSVRKSLRIGDIFKEWAISAFSPSMLDMFFDDRGKWAMKFISKIKDDSNPGIWRGSVIETAIRQAILTGDPNQKDMAIQAMKVTAKAFEIEKAGEIPEDYLTDLEDELDFVACATNRACETILKWMEETGEKFIPESEPGSRRVSLDFGMEIPFVGWLDFEFTNSIFDVKSTSQMPSEYKILWGTANTPPELDVLFDLWKSTDKEVFKKYGNANYLVDDSGYPWRAVGKLIKAAPEKNGKPAVLAADERKIIRSTRPLDQIPKYQGIPERTKRQVASYGKAKGKAPLLFYVGRNKCFIAAVPVGEIDSLVAQYRVAAIAIRQILQTQRTQKDIFSVCPPNFDGFRWDKDSEALAKEMWGFAPVKAA